VKSQILFELFQDEVTSAKPELRKNERNAKGKLAFLLHFQVFSKFGEAKLALYD